MKKRLCVLAVSYRTMSGISQEFLKKGVDVNCQHPYGWRALHAAAINSRSQAVKFLLSKGGDPNLPDNFSNIFQVCKYWLVLDCPESISDILPFAKYLMNFLSYNNLKQFLTWTFKAFTVITISCSLQLFLYKHSITMLHFCSHILAVLLVCHALY